MAVQLDVNGSQEAVIGTVRLTVTDPGNDVASIGFEVTELGSTARGPFGPDRTPSANVFEKDVVLSERRITRVHPLATLHDGTVLRAPTAGFGVRFEPRTAPAGTMASAVVTAIPGALRIDATAGTATRWRCYARLGSWPTADGTPRAALHEDYLRVEATPSETSITMAAAPGRWYVIILGYNGAGQAGPRIARDLQVSA